MHWLWWRHSFDILMRFLIQPFMVIIRPDNAELLISKWLQIETLLFFLFYFAFWTRSWVDFLKLYIGRKGCSLFSQPAFTCSVSNGSTKTVCEICSKWTRKTSNLTLMTYRSAKSGNILQGCSHILWRNL